MIITIESKKIKKRPVPFIQIALYTLLYTSCSESNNPQPVIIPSGAAIESFSPETAFIGDTLTIKGANFGTNPKALSFSFGTTPADVVSSSDTTVKIVVPDGIQESEASVKIQLLTSDGPINTAKVFILKAPVIESISPTYGPVGQLVTITGKGFSKINTKLKFGNSSLDAISPGHTQLTMHVPDLASGKYNVSASVAGKVSNAKEFTVASVTVEPAVPTLTSFNPENGFIGETITITGKGFGTNPHITFGGVDASVVSNTETTAEVIVPDDIEAASVKIHLLIPGPGGSNEIVSANDFKVKAPVIESISPSSGFPGQRISIKGKGFRNSYRFDQITFGNTLIAKNTGTPGNTELQFSAPRNGVAGKYSISVTVLGMTAIANDQFEVIVPAITSFSPETGTEHAIMTITGTNFIDANGGSTSVIFSDKETNLNSTAAYITSLTATEIKVIIPDLIKRTQGWKVSVTVVSGTVTAAKAFDYTE